MARAKRFKFIKFKGVDGIPDFLWPSLKQNTRVRYLMWREVCHVTSSVILLILSLYIATRVSFPVTVLVFTLLAGWITFQEFYLHPRKYGQKSLKGMLDWGAWVLPFAVYFITLYKG